MTKETYRADTPNKFIFGDSLYFQKVKGERLAKLYLCGKEVDRDYEKAIAYLTASAKHGNQYAAQLLHSIHANQNWVAGMGTMRLLQHISRILQNRLEDEQKGKTHAIDRKLKRKINEKKQAHGLRQG